MPTESFAPYRLAMKKKKIITAVFSLFLIFRAICQIQGVGQKSPFLPIQLNDDLAQRTSVA